MNPYRPPADLATPLRTAAAKPHPRLLFTAAEEARLRARMETTPLLRDFVAALRRKADRLLDEPVCARQQIGRRLLHVSRQVLDRVLTLAATYRLSGEARYRQRAEAEMLSAAAFSDWNPSHYLDVAEMSAALALGYDWLHPDLAPESRERIATALLEKGVATYEPCRSHNNWNDVCNGGLIITALALADRDFETCRRVLEGGLAALPVALGTYPPGGAHPEGAGCYWNYATLFSVPMLAVLEAACDTDFGLTEAFPGFVASGGYYAHMFGPTGLYHNYNDSGRGQAALAPQVFWLARRAGQPAWVTHELARFRHHVAQDRIGCRMAPFALFWLPETDEARWPKEHHYQAGGMTPVASHRTSWTDKDASFISLKGGSPGGPHGHMDGGSFVFDAAGVRWALDLGLESYHAIETRGLSLWNMSQDSDRWRIFRLGTASHNTLMIDGQDQRVDGKATLARTGTTFTVMDLSSLYSTTAEKVQRGVHLFPDGRALIQDEIVLQRDGEMRWAMLTAAAVTPGGATAQLEQDGRTLSLHVLCPQATETQVFVTEPPPAEYDSPNPGTCMVGFTVSGRAGKALRLAVLLDPGVAEPRPALQPLAAWSAP